VGLKKRKQSKGYKDITLNIIPFIDVFSMLNTFLLFSAVFVSSGIIEVQVPFLSSAKAPDSKKVRSFAINVRVEKERIELTSEYSMPPKNEFKTEFKADAAGITSLHEKLIEMKTANPDTDLATVYCEDDVVYESLAKVLDAVKYRLEKDPVFKKKLPDGTQIDDKEFLLPKVVMGSVIL